LADLSKLSDVEALANAVLEGHKHLDVLINNAGIYSTANNIAESGLDVRFVVNTIAPYLLSKKLISLFNSTGRIINLSSAAQSPVNMDALTGKIKLSDDFTVYAQSKLALTMWSNHMAQEYKDKGLIIFSVNPGSMLATKMVKEGFGVAGNDIRIGADILVRASLSDEFVKASGQYFDNDYGQFSSPHQDATDTQKRQEIVNAIEDILS